jgi:hypothetical protein
MPPKRRASTRVLSAQDVAKKPRVDEESDDEPAWRKIKVEDLDFDASYVGNYEQPTPPTPSKLPKRKRWTHYGDEPLIKTEDLPHGWTSDERVLDPQCVHRLLEDNSILAVTDPSFFLCFRRKVAGHCHLPPKSDAFYT